MAKSSQELGSIFEVGDRESKRTVLALDFSVIQTDGEFSVIASEWKRKPYVNLDLITDDIAFFNASKDPRIPGSKKSLEVVGITFTNKSKLYMKATMNSDSYFIKCTRKNVASNYVSFYCIDRSMSTLENEARAYAFIKKNEDLQSCCLKMLAHGEMIDFSTDVPETYEAIVLPWVDQSLAGVMPSYQNDEGAINSVTETCFKLLYELHKNNLTHGDARMDQLALVTVDGDPILKWFDFEKAVARHKAMDDKTWNVRKLIDFNFLLIGNPISATKYRVFSNMNKLDFKSLKKKLDTVHPDIGRAIIPGLYFMVDGGGDIFDRRSCDFYCDHYYGPGNSDFLETFDIDEFLNTFIQNSKLVQFVNDVCNVFERIPLINQQDLVDRGSLVPKEWRHRPKGILQGPRGRQRPSSQNPQIEPAGTSALQPPSAQPVPPAPHAIVSNSTLIPAGPAYQPAVPTYPSAPPPAAPMPFVPLAPVQITSVYVKPTDPRRFITVNGRLVRNERGQVYSYIAYPHELNVFLDGNQMPLRFKAPLDVFDLDEMSRVKPLMITDANGYVHLMAISFEYDCIGLWTKEARGGYTRNNNASYLSAVVRHP